MLTSQSHSPNAFIKAFDFDDINATNLTTLSCLNITLSVLTAFSGLFVSVAVLDCLETYFDFSSTPLFSIALS